VAANAAGVRKWSPGLKPHRSPFALSVKGVTHSALIRAQQKRGQLRPDLRFKEIGNPTKRVQNENTLKNIMYLCISKLSVRFL
jgi:hypothetical protein